MWFRLAVSGVCDRTDRFKSFLWCWEGGVRWHETKNNPLFPSNAFKLNPPGINIFNRHEFYVSALAEKLTSNESDWKAHKVKHAPHAGHWGRGSDPPGVLRLKLKRCLNLHCEKDGKKNVSWLSSICPSNIGKDVKLTSFEYVYAQRGWACPENVRRRKFKCLC